MFFLFNFANFNRFCFFYFDDFLGGVYFLIVVFFFTDVFALMSKMPDSEFFFNLDESILKDTDENAYISYNNCSPESPGESSCDDGYSSDGKFLFA